MLENIKKGNKGITLIALIITIVVMLILVAVTLDIAIGENGLVNKAKTAGEATTREVERETLLTAAIGAMDNNGTVNFGTLDRTLPEGFTGTNGTYTSKNGNTFTVSTNGEILYTGENSSENEMETVDLRGKYYAYAEDDDSFYFEIIDNNNGVIVSDGEELDCQTVIDHDDKTVTITYEQEGLYTNTMTTETATMEMNYELVVENNKVVNILLVGFDGTAVLFQNEKGFENDSDLDGVYVAEYGSSSYIFNSEDNTVVSTYDSANDEYTYAKVNGIYFIIGGRMFEVSEDKNTINIGGEYTRQTN